MLGFIVSTFAKIVGVVLSIFFILIPTLLFNPRAQIPFIEQSLCVTFPAKYSVLDKQEEWFAFEDHYEVTFSFGDSEFNNLLQQIKADTCQNGSWQVSADTRRFVLSSDFRKEKDYYFDAILSEKKKTLEYSFSTF